MVYWIQFDKGWTRERMFKDSIIDARKYAVDILRGGRYDYKAADIYTSADAEMPIGTVIMHKHGDYAVYEWNTYNGRTKRRYVMMKDGTIIR